MSILYEEAEGSSCSGLMLVRNVADTKIPSFVNTSTMDNFSYYSVTHKRKQVKLNFMIAVRMWSIYKILSWRDWLSLRSHIDDLQLLFLYNFVEEEGILVLHGIFRFGGCHEISLLKSLRAYQKFIWFFKWNTTSIRHIVTPFQLSCFVISWEQRKPGPGSLSTTYV